MCDIIIIGSGPAGLAAAIYAMRAGKKVIVIEKEYEGTGQIALSSKVDNYPGYYNIDGYELGEHFREHALYLGTEIKNATVKMIKHTGEVFKVTVKERKKEEVLEAANILYCAGARHRTLNVKGEKELQGKGVSYCATCDGSFFKDKEVAVIGGGDTALDDALYLSDIAKNVTILHRRDTFRGSFTTLEKLRKKENVNIITGVNVTMIEGVEHVEKLILDNGKEIKAEGVFIAVGMVPETELLGDMVEYDNAGYVLAGEDGRTTHKGLYVAGDVRSKGLRQVVTAVADGANAINSILQDM